MNFISISSPTRYPESLIRFSARSSILTGSPISRIKISPPLAYAPACKTSETASGMVMKYRIMLGSVTVTGPPAAICLRNKGMTEPLLPSTLPNLTATNLVFLYSLSQVCIIISQMRLLAPIIFVGFTALSVDIITKMLVPFSAAALAVLSVPKTLFLIDSQGLTSISGTCLCAAA